MENRLKRLRQLMQQQNREALLITHPINRRYISGFSGSAGLLLILDKKAILLTDGRYLIQAKEQAPHFEVVEHKKDIFAALVDVCKNESVASLSFEEVQMTYAEYRKLAKLSDPIKLVPQQNMVEKLRLIKDQQELKTIRQATKIVDEVFAQIVSEIRPGLTERQLETRMEMLMREKGATSSSFSTIVASGVRSALPHGIASDKKLAKNELITLDFGCWVDGYTSDLTRTIVLGEANSRMKEIYGIVLEAQEAALAGLRPGLTGNEVDQFARGVINGHGYGDYFRHSTGHGIGLEVHELPYLSLSSVEVLEPGMVITIEPGIYIPDFGGVRIEDDVVITESGASILTQATKKLITIN